MGQTLAYYSDEVRSLAAGEPNPGMLARAPELGGRRREFAAEIRDAVRRTEAIEALAAGRRAGLID